MIQVTDYPLTSYNIETINHISNCNFREKILNNKNLIFDSEKLHKKIYKKMENYR